MAPAHDDAFPPPVMSELVLKLPRDRDRGRGRESSKDRGRERESSRDRGTGRESSRDRGRERESSRDRGRGRESSRDRGRERESSRDRGRERESSRDRGRERESSRDRGRGRESSRDRGRGRESSRDRGDVDRDRRIGIQTSGGRREEFRQSSRDRSRRYNDNDAADLRKQDAYDDQKPISIDRGRGYDEDDQRPVSRDQGRGYDDDDQRSMGKDRGREYEDDDRRHMGRDRGREFDEERQWMSRDGGGAYEDDERRPMGGGRGRGRGGRGDSNNDKPAAPPLYSILRATVHSIRPFGIFVQMEGYRNHGLVHLSQVSDHEVTNRDDSEEAKVKALSSIASEGEQVWVKVISINVEENGNTKTGCSMKYVRQGDGEDLDPNNIQAEKQQSRPAWKEPQKFKLEAVLNVQCQRCGGHGHLKKECYSSGEKTYKLLSDDEDVDLTVQNRMNMEDRLPRENLKHTQPPKPVIGISNHLLARGSVGRGRAVVQPAWMKHGIGVGGPAPPEEDDPKLKQVSALPEKLENVGDALAVLALLKEEKHRRKEERHKKKEKRHKERDEKHKSKKEERHKSRDGDKEKHKKRKHRDEKGRKERHSSSRKKHRGESSS